MQSSHLYQNSVLQNVQFCFGFFSHPLSSTGFLYAYSMYKTIRHQRLPLKIFHEARKFYESFYREIISKAAAGVVLLYAHVCRSRDDGG